MITEMKKEDDWNVFLCETYVSNIFNWQLPRWARTRAIVGLLDSPFSPSGRRPLSLASISYSLPSLFLFALARVLVHPLFLNTHSFTLGNLRTPPKPSRSLIISNQIELLAGRTHKLVSILCDIY